MKHLYILLLVFAGHIVSAQSNCRFFDSYVKKGDDEINKGNSANFEYAINQYSIAMVHCPDRAEEARAKILIAFEAIEKLKRDAVKSEQKAQKALKEVVLANAKTNSALQKAQKLIDAFYFYDGKYALAYGKKGWNNVFYFIDTLGNEVAKLGQWEKAEQFDERGFAKVIKSLDDTNYLLDTLGNLYSVAYTLEDLTEETQALDLSGSKIDTLQVDTVLMRNLKVLITNSEITNLPTQIGNLHKLTHLDLAFTLITSLPSQIGNLKNLTHLTLYNSQITNLPTQVGNFRNLTYLNLAGTSITSLPPEIGKLNKLTVLDLHDSKITSLPPEIGKLQNLTELDLSGTEITSLPPEIGKLNKLSELYLSGTEITSLPPEIGKLNKLSELYLSFTAIMSLPPEIGKLNNLTYLDLRETPITSLPPEIGKLNNLTYLDLRETPITSLPPEIGNLKNLTYLNLYSTKVTSLPPEIGNLKNLVWLYLMDTQIPPQEIEIIKKLLPNCEVVY
jgi:Leucine-rich repeat (LRR) protein